MVVLRARLPWPREVGHHNSYIICALLLFLVKMKKKLVIFFYFFYLFQTSKNENFKVIQGQGFIQGQVQIQGHSVTIVFMVIAGVSFC